MTVGETTLAGGQLGAHLFPEPRNFVGLYVSPVGRPQPGDYFVVAYKAPGIVARSIGWVTGSKWTHAGVYLGDGQIGEAHPNGFRTASLSAYEGRADVAWSRRSLSDHQRDLIVQNAGLLASMKIGYGWADVLSIAALRANVGIAPALRRLHRPDKMICSAAVAYLYRWAKAPLTAIPEDDDIITPKDLATIANA